MAVNFKSVGLYAQPLLPSTSPWSAICTAGMFHTYEFLYLLFSMSEMMLSVSVKPFIVDVIRQRELRDGSAYQDRPKIVSNDSMAPPETTSVTLRSIAAKTYGRQDKENLYSEKHGWGGSIQSQSPSASGVEAKAGMYLMIDLVGCYLPWTVLGPVCGVWSDRQGRKLPLLISLVGHVISVVFYMLAQYHPDHLLAAVILGSVSRGLAGKHSMFTMVIYSMTYASLTGSRSIGLSIGFAGRESSRGFRWRPLQHGDVISTPNTEHSTDHRICQGNASPVTSWMRHNETYVYRHLFRKVLCVLLPRGRR
ncbi:hypothetical protein BaRGS_00018869 [Batillaria attramentaria]|uniref:Uncharacterized protein n=1 Tax=Batillaria attramentaria TaxID=370345 RepID=A0ABD0KRX5_9CAEN